MAGFWDDDLRGEVRQLCTDRDGEYDLDLRSGWMIQDGVRVTVRGRGISTGIDVPLAPSTLDLNIRLRVMGPTHRPQVNLAAAGRAFNERFLTSGSPPALVRAMLADTVTCARMVATHGLYEITTDRALLRMDVVYANLDNIKDLVGIGANMARAHHAAMQADGPYR